MVGPRARLSSVRSSPSASSPSSGFGASPRPIRPPLAFIPNFRLVSGLTWLRLEPPQPVVVLPNGLLLLQRVPLSSAHLLRSRPFYPPPHELNGDRVQIARTTSLGILTNGSQRSRLNGSRKSSSPARYLSRGLTSASATQNQFSCVVTTLPNKADALAKFAGDQDQISSDPVQSRGHDDAAPTKRKSIPS